MSKKKIPLKEQKRLEKIRVEDIRRRYFRRNHKAMTFCNENGLTIYPSARGDSASGVKLFVQRGVGFKPLNDILYDQNDTDDVMAYVAAIDTEYERIYLKMKGHLPKPRKQSK